ncbi:MAG: trypsin-like peptidase domain-containing protein [Bacilli bacterium]|jgi:serine protease Do|nr:trypsin-like peptidase domain-containing protein [Bacilli bacterium]
MKKKLIYFLLIIVTFFMGAASNFILFEYYYKPTTETINKTINEIKVEETLIEEAIDKIYDSVVVVETIRNNKIVASGTGFIYKVDNKKGYIITNHHVISGGNAVEIIFSGGKRAEATILGSDVYADIAVLGIDKNNVTTIAEIGTAKDLKIGSTVFAIGAPVGAEYGGTVTRGIISGNERLVATSLSGSSSNDWLMRVVQTDAAINPGNSGGPLVNIAGQVIGVNSLKLVDEKIEGIGFAIPIDDAMKYVTHLEKGEAINRPFLGVQLLDVTETFALFYNNIDIDDDIEVGAVIQDVVKDSAADKAKLKKGDVIIKMDDKMINNKAELRYQLYNCDVGDKIKVTYYRDKKINTVQVTLDKLEEE